MRLAPQFCDWASQLVQLAYIGTKRGSGNCRPRGLLIRKSSVRVTHALPPNLALENQALASDRGAFFSSVARVCRRQKLAFAGKLPERKNPGQAISIFRMESGNGLISQRGVHWRAPQATLLRYNFIFSYPR